MGKPDVHYCDFSGNLDETACGLPLTDDLESAIDGDEHGLVTILETSTTCGGCRVVIDGERPAANRARADRPAPAVTAAL